QSQTFPMPVPTQLSGTSTDGNGSGQSPITETTADGGHMHADGTYHPAPPSGAPARSAAAAAAVPAVIPGLAAQPRRGIQLQHGEQVAAAGAARGAKPNVTEGPKLGRNDPCFCGSGKKYKRCHGA
ncbi:MAG: SEC-C metal-binding domain-containing protein, partial [Chloroflexota bacterium]